MSCDQFSKSDQLQPQLYLLQCWGCTPNGSTFRDIFRHAPASPVADGPFSLGLQVQPGRGNRSPASPQWPVFFKVTTGSSSWLPMFCAQEHCIWYVLGALFLVETLHQATKVVLQLWQVHQKKTNIVPPNWDNVLQNHSQQLARVNSQLTWEGSVMTCRGVNNWLIGFPLLQESPHNL